MAESGKPKSQSDLDASANPPPRKLPGHDTGSNAGQSNSGRRVHYPNPPDTVNPDAATLKDQWRYAIRQYSKWYSHAWGTAILAGAAFFALGWVVKGQNPLSSLKDDPKNTKHPSDD